MGLFDDDIVRDVLRRVVEAAARGDGGFTDSMAREIERQVRADWSGARPYVRSDQESRRIERDEKILAAWEAGNRDTRQLAARFGISQRQVRRIVSG